MSSQSKVMRAVKGRARGQSRAVVLSRSEWNALLFVRSEAQREIGKSLTVREVLSIVLIAAADHMADRVAYVPCGGVKT